jgi:endonuclease YncB( thermonuclease family)
MTTSGDLGVPSKFGVRRGAAGRVDSSFVGSQPWFGLSSGTIGPEPPMFNADSVFRVWSGDTVTLFYTPEGRRERRIRFDMSDAKKIVDDARTTCGPSWSDMMSRR